MPRITRLFLLILPAMLLVLSVWGERKFYRNDSQTIFASSIFLSEENPELTAVGALDFLGGWQLQSDNTDFGGFSALSRLPDGRFLAISDAGQMMGFAFAASGQMKDGFFAPLPGAEEPEDDSGEPNYAKRDSESVTSDPDHHFYWVGYENDHAIRRFGNNFVSISAEVKPKEMKHWPQNGGAEAMVRLADGRFLVFSESEGKDVPQGARQLLLFSKDPTDPEAKVSKLAYRPPLDFSPTEAVQMPDGRLLILNRAFGFPKGFRVWLTIAHPDDLSTGSVLESHVIAKLDPPLSSDNFEGMWIEKGVGGRTSIWLISDDNNNVFQRTLLLHFALEESRLQPEARARRNRQTIGPGFQLGL